MAERAQGAAAGRTNGVHRDTEVSRDVAVARARLGEKSPHDGPSPHWQAIDCFADRARALGGEEVVVGRPIPRGKVLHAGVGDGDLPPGSAQHPERLVTGHSGEPGADPLGVTDRAHSLDESELRRALAAATRCLIGELEAWDPVLCARLSPLLHEFGAPQAQAHLPSSPHVLAEQEE